MFFFVVWRRVFLVASIWFKKWLFFLVFPNLVPNVIGLGFGINWVFPITGLANVLFFKAATSALSSRLNAKALPTGCYGEHTYKGELTKITSLAKVNSLNKVSLLKLVNYFSKVNLFTHTNPFYKLEHAYKGDLTYTCELADKGEPTFTSELNLKGDHTYKGDFA